MIDSRTIAENNIVKDVNNNIRMIKTNKLKNVVEEVCLLIIHTTQFKLLLIMTNKQIRIQSATLKSLV